MDDLFKNLQGAFDEELEKKIQGLRAEHKLDLNDSELRELKEQLDLSSAVILSMRLEEENIVEEIKKLNLHLYQIRESFKTELSQQTANLIKLVTKCSDIRPFKDQLFQLDDMMRQESNVVRNSMGYKLILSDNSVLPQGSYVRLSESDVTPTMIQKQILDFLGIKYHIEHVNRDG